MNFHASITPLSWLIGTWISDDYKKINYTVNTKNDDLEEFKVELQVSHPTNTQPVLHFK